MLDMVDSLMDINRMEEGVLVAAVAAVNFKVLIERVVGKMKVLADQRQIALFNFVDPELPLVWADKDMIRRVLINLLDNTLKYTPSGGRIECRANIAPTADSDREPGVPIAKDHLRSR